MSILVVGSLCVDNTLYVSSLPLPGETVIAHSALTSLGGKGANQALAAKMAGGEVAFLACTGNDSASHEYRQHLEKHGIDSRSLVTDPAAPTGSAFLSVEDSGENSIVINPGANHALRPEHLDQHLDLFKNATHLLLQLEIPFDTIRHACRLARENEVTILINPSPWSDEFNTSDFPCDVLIVNEHEATSFFGKEGAKPSGKLLETLDLQTLLVTHGAEPTLVVTQSDEPFESPPPVVTPVDTVGAGDAFTGALAVALAENQSLENAVRFANTAASLSILKPGAQGATPTREEIESAIRQTPSQENL
ncbi:MAG: ribokinase [Akkermansiaceae bacterium]